MSLPMSLVIRNATSGRTVAMCKVNIKQSKISEISIRLTKGGSFQKGRAEVWTVVDIK